jgi:hypothetical protein
MGGRVRMRDGGREMEETGRKRGRKGRESQIGRNRDGGRERG